MKEQLKFEEPEILFYPIEDLTIVPDEEVPT